FSKLMAPRQFSAWAIEVSSGMILTAGPGGYPTPLDAYFLPLRVQKISAVSRPGKPNRSLISTRIIGSSVLLQGMARAFRFGAQKLRPETCPIPLYTESY